MSFADPSPDDAPQNDGPDLHLVAGEDTEPLDFDVVRQTPDPLRVLLIEDDPDHAALVEAYLHEVHDPAVDLRHAATVGAGTEALAHAEASGRPFHVVLTDQQLPDSDYWETVGRVVAAAHSAPVVALTSLGDLDVALEAVREGASDYLVKSELSPELLRRTLRYAFERASRDEALRATNEALRQTLRHVRQMHAQVVEQEKLAAFGRLLSGVAHELRNPLGLAMNAAEALEAEVDALASALSDPGSDVADRLAELRDLAQHVARNGRRADGVVRSMYEHSRGIGGDVREVSLQGVARAALARLPADGVEVDLDIDPDLTVAGSGSALTRMLANLLENAFLAARLGGGTVSVRAAASQGPQEREAVLTIEDDGPGLAGDIVASAFEPFESGWISGRRIGLGLSIARAVVVGHQGRIELRSSETGGTRAIVHLPLAPEVASDA